MMRNISFFFLAVLVLAGCSSPFKKGDKGLEYKIISNGKGKKLTVGKFMQFHLAQYYNNGHKDSLLNDTRSNGGPLMEMLDSNSMPSEIYKICAQLRKGDSMVLRISTDTIIKQQQGMVPPFMKRGNYYVQTLRILNVFDTRNEADSARRAEFEKTQVAEKKKAAEQLKKDDKTIQEYLTKNKINAVKAPEGTYVQIIKPGTGMKVDTTVVVNTKYTGKTMDGKTFDSNTDPAFGHVGAFNVNMTNDYSLGGGVIKGWTDGLSLLSEGAVAKFYIPSGLAYGSRGAGDKIPADAILMFDIEVVDVMTKAEAKADIEKEKAKAEMERKRYMDSVSRAKKDTAVVRKK
jgi:hypothetical protein